MYLNEKGIRDYPKFDPSKLKIHECEVCKAIKNVKKYAVIKRNIKISEVFLCDSCATDILIERDDVNLIKIETMNKKKSISSKSEKEKKRGGLLLI